MSSDKAVQDIIAEWRLPAEAMGHFTTGTEAVLYVQSKCDSPVPPMGDLAMTLVGSLLVQLAEARAALDKLPETADGVPVTDGMTLWFCGPCGAVPSTVSIARFFSDGGHACGDFDICYSTREAAEASRVQAEKGAGDD